MVYKKNIAKMLLNSAPCMKTKWLSAICLILICTITIRLLIQFRPTVKSGAFNNGQPRNAPIIFVGGHQSTGTGLMRILLDVHPMVRCGPEPIITSEVMRFRLAAKKYEDKLLHSGISHEAVDEATAAFIVSIIENMGPPAERLCHKQPGIYYHLRDLGDLFHEAKFIHMIRDGRAAVLSTIERNIDYQFAANNPVKAVNLWEEITRQMISDCKYIGKSRCLTVRYECLILAPEIQLRRILKFLDLPWDDILLRHETVVRKVSKLNYLEQSTKQFINPIYVKSLDLWAKNNSKISQCLLKVFSRNTNLLMEMGYPINEMPPDYRKMCEKSRFNE
ncbi:Protein-tyrosine sulfotransferase A [Schistosoma japonicum]|nr:Protein-tyrosine sulfotransferase A [Schistosoma japonicum]